MCPSGLNYYDICLYSAWLLQQLYVKKMNHYKPGLSELRVFEMQPHS